MKNRVVRAMRTAERLVELLLGQDTLLEALAHAFIFQPGSSTPEHRLLQTQAEISDVRNLANQGVNSVIYLTKNLKIELASRDKEAFVAHIRQALPRDYFLSLVQKAEQAEKEQARIKKGEGYRHANKPREQFSPEELAAHDAQIYGMGSGQPPRLGGRYRSTPGRRGVVLTQVDPDGPLAQAGVRKNDAIMRIGDDTIRDQEHMQSVLQSLVPQTPYLLLVRRRGQDFKTRVVPQGA